MDRIFLSTAKEVLVSAINSLVLNS